MLLGGVSVFAFQYSELTSKWLLIVYMLRLHTLLITCQRSLNNGLHLQMGVVTAYTTRRLQCFLGYRLALITIHRPSYFM